MKISLSILLSLCTLIVYSQGSSNNIYINDYSKLSVRGRCEVIYEQNKDSRSYIRIEVSDEYRNNVDYNDQSGELSIGTNINNTGTNSYNPDANIKIYTSSTNLKEISVTGNSKVEIKGNLNSSDLKLSISGSGVVTTIGKISSTNNTNIYIKGNGILNADNFEARELGLYIGGSGNINIENIRTSSFTTSISGSGTATIKSGSANETNFRVKGNGIIDALNVMTTHSDNGINGSGKIITNSSKYLKGRINGSGRIFYSGSPSEIDRKIYGNGKVLPAELPSDTE